MKKGYSTAILIGAAIFLMVSGNNASAYTIDDTTNALWGDTSSDTLPGSTAGWHDFVSPTSSQFDTHGINVSFSGGRVNFDIFTNFNGYDMATRNGGLPYYSYLADFALSVDGLPGYEYGVVLDPHSGRLQIGDTKFAPESSLGVGLYSVTDWQTSSQLWEEENWSGYNTTTGDAGYGEQYDQANPKDAIVSIGAGSLLASGFTTSWDTSNIGSASNPALSFSFDTSALQGFNGSADVFWGTATCGNDPIAGGVSPVPEPTTMLLFGTGLAGLVGLRKKRTKEA